MMTILESVGGKLRISKRLSRDSHLIWLAGPWLDGAYKMPAALQMQAPELVRGHFFEPAIAVNSGNCPLFDPGLCAWARRSSPLRLGVNICVHDPNPLFSVTVQNGIDLLPKTLSCGSIAESFPPVERCFTNCIQQCLSREPLLAVALSTIEIDEKSFQEAISTNWRQSLSQRTVGQLDGALYELFFFAALQLASHSKGRKLCGVVDFINQVKCYVCKYKGKKIPNLKGEMLENLRLNSDYETERNNSTDNLEWHTYVVDGNIIKRQQNVTKMFGDCKIPWLVPANSKENLMKLSSKVFGDVIIAGLFPTERNASFNAQVYVLRPAKAEDWVFEFRARADYSLNAAVQDLKRKCEKYKDAKLCHAMLIAVRKGFQSQAAAWEVKGAWNKRLFRVAIVLGEA